MSDFVSQLSVVFGELLQKRRGIKLEQQELSEIESQVRQIFGGDRVYIGKTSVDAIREQSNRDRALLRDWQRGDSVQVIARRYQVTPRRVQQLVQNRETDCLNGFAANVDSPRNEPIREPANNPVRRRHTRSDV